ncbi:MAG: hypothetical protein RLZZ127_2822 [Planctomycetota bacterium]|jgi:2-desacetyl-2-hydroxyethyl bacteriochlorophyllide A dehydrogenase
MTGSSSLDRSATIPAAGRLAWEPCPPPVPAPGQVAVRTLATLLSPGTELAFWCGTHAGLNDPAMPWAKYPFRPGYAAVGEVVAVGDGVTVHRPGDRVLYRGNHAAWACAAPDWFLPVPAGLDPAHALFARLAQIAATAVVRARRIPRRCVVLGAGPVGILAAQQLRNHGAAQVVIRDLSPARLALARACGIAAVPAGAAHDEEVRGCLGGEPALVVEATGVPALAVDALRAVAAGGEVVLLGSPRGPVEIATYQLVHVKNVSLTGAHECAVAEGAPRQAAIREALEDIAAGRIRVAPLVSHRLHPDRLAEAYDGCATAKDAWFGVVLDWTRP